MNGYITLPRVVLRPITADIAHDVVEGVRQSDWAPDYPTDGDVVICSLVLKAVESGIAYQPPTVITPWTGSWQVCVRGTEEEIVIGGIGFKGSPQHGEVEIGYGIAESARGHGYVSDSVRALVQLADDLDLTVIAETEPGNDASERVLERCGFVRTHTADDGNLWWRAR